MKTQAVGIGSGRSIRIKIKGNDMDGEDLIKAGLATTSTPSVSATTVLGSATATAGTVLQSGGTGLISSGPQSGSAATVLDAMNQLGSAGAAAWSVQNPSLGGSAQVIVGTIVGGIGGGSSSSAARNTRQPS